MSTWTAGQSCLLSPIQFRPVSPCGPDLSSTISTYSVSQQGSMSGTPGSWMNTCHNVLCSALQKAESFWKWWATIAFDRSTLFGIFGVTSRSPWVSKPWFPNRGSRFPIKQRFKWGKSEVKKVKISKLQTYPNLHPPPRVGPALGCLPRGGANLCRFVPVRSSQKRAWGREFVHVCFGLLGRVVQVGANLDGFGALRKRGGSRLSFPQKARTTVWKPPFTLPLGSDTPDTKFHM